MSLTCQSWHRRQVEAAVAAAYAKGREETLRVLTDADLTDRGSALLYFGEGGCLLELPKRLITTVDETVVRFLSARDARDAVNPQEVVAQNDDELLVQLHEERLDGEGGWDQYNGEAIASDEAPRGGRSYSDSVSAQRLWQLR